MKFFSFTIFLLLIYYQSLAQLDTIDNNKKIGLVLSGGGAKGFAHIGVLKILEEKKIDIDCISGTSMGAVVGSLYAMGYTAIEIEKMIKNQDWQKVFSDKVNRKHLSLSERRDIERYIVNFPIGEKGINLPDRLFSRKNIMNSLITVSKQYNAELDFKKDLPRAFVCIATDLETGEEVILDKGNFVECIYASMAIPAIFSPVKIDNKLLIDGGVSNNFPVEELKKMGAEIIIGVDVQHGRRDKREINNISDIVFQLLDINTKPQQDSSKIKLCDIYIKPELENYRLNNFSEMEEITELGEKHAKEILSNIIGKNYNPPKHDFSKKYEINNINLLNFPDVSNEEFIKTFKLSFPLYSTENDIKKLINRIYYRYNLSYVHYYFSGKNFDILNIKLIKNKDKTFNIGLHFNQDQGAEILVNTSFYNLGFRNSKLSLDAILSQYPGFRIKYNLLTKKIPNLRFMSFVKNYQLNLYDKNNKIFSNTLTTYKIDISTNFLFKNSYSLGGGVQLFYYNFKDDPGDYFKHDFLSSLYLFLDINTLDDKYYPKRGFSFYGEVKSITNDDLKSESSKLLISYFDIKKVFNISDKLTLLANSQSRNIISNTDPPVIFDNYFYGENNSLFIDRQIQISGTKYLQKADAGILSAGLDVRLNPWNKHYFYVKSNIASVFDLDKGSIREYYGLALSYSYRSIIGPMNITLAKSNMRNEPILYFNIGYSF